MNEEEFPEEFKRIKTILRLRELIVLSEFDPERAHIEGDKILCEVLIEAGFEEYVELWMAIDKFYW